MNIKLRILELFSRLVLQRAFFPLNVDRLRSNDKFTTPSKAIAGCTYSSEKLGHIPVHTITPPQIDSDEWLMYVHGGAYVCGPSNVHWETISLLASKTKRKAILVQYRLAPENQYMQASDDFIAIFKHLHEDKKATNVTVLGDSAGGGLTLGSTLRMRDEGLPLPKQLVLYAPWLDATMSNPDISLNEKKDAILGRQGLIDAGKLYAGDQDPKHPYISPIYGDLSDLPPMLLQIGTRDMFLADCRLFKQKAEEAGIQLQYTEAEHMPHAYSVLTALFQEARDAIDETTTFIMHG